MNDLSQTKPEEKAGGSRMYRFFNRYRKYILILIDACIAALAYLTPFLLSGIHAAKLQWYVEQVPLFVLIFVTTFILMGVYRNIWRYAGIEELLLCLKAPLVANAVFLALTLILKISIRGYVYPVALVVSCLAVLASRILYKSLQIIYKRRPDAIAADRNRVMIIGAGDAAVMLLNEMKQNNPNQYEVCCLIDDNKTKVGRRIGRTPVVGDSGKIIDIAANQMIDTIILAIPSLDPENKKRILNICAKTGCKLKQMPDIQALLARDKQKDLIASLRDVQMEDLLGRDVIALDCSLAGEYISGKTVLVTGAGGSIGSELCRQIAPLQPKELILLDIYENNVYMIEQELRRLYGQELSFQVEIASVREYRKIDYLFREKPIDVVFHAAAHKHVPFMEHNPSEAIKNNVFGTCNMAAAADRHKVEKFVLISTDKAVNPTNIMGATKRICEMIIQYYSKISESTFTAVRFGNVLGSNGSVIPLFLEQINQGGPVTVTHKDITRYFMTIPEAVRLVLKAGAIAEDGEIFVLDMGEPVKINDLALNLIRLAGLTPGKDIQIEYTGLRPGEKLNEELLISPEKNQRQTGIDKIFVEAPIAFDEEEFTEIIGRLDAAAEVFDVALLISLIKKLVPSYRNSDEVICAASAEKEGHPDLVVLPLTRSAAEKPASIRVIGYDE